jgi:hypothetical protein
MAWSNPSVADFKAYFFRDFPYGTDLNTSVLDQDIATAFQLTNVNINQGLYASQANYTIGYQLLSAHFLVLNLRQSSQGINGQFAFLEQSKGVGGVNSSFAIPQRILDNPEWSVLAKTNYGMQYLALLIPALSGQMYTVMGPAFVPAYGGGGFGLGLNWDTFS